MAEPSVLDLITEAVRRADAAEAAVIAVGTQRDVAWADLRAADLAAERTRAELSRVRAAIRSLCDNFDPTSGSGRAQALIGDIRAVLREGRAP